jgi:hypothetical protein
MTDWLIWYNVWPRWLSQMQRLCEMKKYISESSAASCTAILSLISWLYKRSTMQWLYLYIAAMRLQLNVYWYIIFKYVSISICGQWPNHYSPVCNLSIPSMKMTIVAKMKAAWNAVSPVRENVMRRTGSLAWLSTSAAVAIRISLWNILFLY